MLPTAGSPCCASPRPAPVSWRRPAPAPSAWPPRPSAPWTPTSRTPSRACSNGSASRSASRCVKFAALNRAMNAEEAALRAYYDRDEERDRLSDGRGQLEFIRTTEILMRRLPPPPAVVADIGGGPGRYALWLASLGHQVEHRDLMPLHVSQLQVDAAGIPRIRTAIGDAREVDLPDASVDVVLLLGPLYHLPQEAERIAAIREAVRILRPGGPLFAAAISRWA